LKRGENFMEFLVEFEMNVPDGIPQSEVSEREQAEASAAAKLTADAVLPAARRGSASSKSATPIRAIAEPTACGRSSAERRRQAG
jgi:hypothetical protein